jgi:hypothetical protein
MAAVKRLNSDYTITNKDTWLANVTVATHTFFVQGNLLVGGNTTQVTKTDLSVTDNLIVLNSGETSTGITLGTAGIEVDRGLSANVQLIYREQFKKWSLTNDGTIYGNISFTTGAYALAVYDDKAPQLGGNLDVLGTNIFSSNTANVRFDDNVAIQYTTVTPTTYSGYNVVYTQTPASGGSGLYVTNTTNANRELASTTKAIVYALVL